MHFHRTPDFFSLNFCTGLLRKQALIAMVFLLKPGRAEPVLPQKIQNI
jgi:hypothetical protein